MSGAYREEIVRNQARDMDIQREREQMLAAQARLMEIAAHEKLEEAQRLKIRKHKMRTEANAVGLGERGKLTDRQPYFTSDGLTRIGERALANAHWHLGWLTLCSFKASCR
jgi:hypothetical protein